MPPIKAFTCAAIQALVTDHGFNPNTAVFPYLGITSVATGRSGDRAEARPHQRVTVEFPTMRTVIQFYRNVVPLAYSPFPSAYTCGTLEVKVMAGRSRRRRAGRRGNTRLLAALGALMAVGALVQVVREHPIMAALAGLVVAAAGAGWLYLRVARARRLAEYERNVAVTDGMSGPDFEQYVARLLRATGCRRVTVCGGRNDMGADITAYLPDGRRLVVQCKRYVGKLGSPDVQRFAGTVRDIHGADVALLVTTGFPSKPAWEVARRCRITLVDRPALARWVSTRVAPIDGTRVAGPSPPRQRGSGVV